jgi:flagellin
MDWSIRTNLGSKLSILSLSRNYSDLFHSLEKLASGKRINRASDGPAELVISMQLESRIVSLNREIEGVSSTINKYETVSSSVMQLRERLTELRSLAVGAANGGGNDDTSQEAFASSAELLVENYNRDIARAGYNGQATLDGSEGSLASISELEGIDLSSPESAAASLEGIDAAASELDHVMMDLGATMKHELRGRRQALEVTRENLIAAQSSILDTDYAVEISNFAAGLIRTRAAMAVLGHSLMTDRSVISLFD